MVMRMYILILVIIGTCVLALLALFLLLFCADAMKRPSWPARRALRLSHVRARKPTAFSNGLTAIQALRRRDYEWLRKHTHRGRWGRPARIDTWPRDRCISWAMVLAARHARTDQWSRNQRQEFHAKLDKEGFITIQNFLKLKMCRCLKVTPQDVERVLRYDEENGSRNGKRRFGTRWLGHRLEAFAAEQGHTTRACDQIDMDRRLQRMEVGDDRIPEILLHGTFRKHLANIWREGLRAGGRNDVHTVRSINGMHEAAGVRGASDTVIFIDGEALRRDSGVVIRRSSNDVFLVERMIPKAYLMRAVTRATCKVIAMPKQVGSRRDISFDEIKRLMNKGSDVPTHLSDVESISSDEATHNDHLNDEELRAKIAYLEHDLKRMRTCAVKAANDE